MSISEWLVVFLACLGGALSPGPSLAVVIRHASRSAHGGVLCAWAHASGVAVYATLAVTGIAVLLAAHPLLRLALWLVAGLWLIRLGSLAWAERNDVLADAQVQGAAARDGFAMAMANPKVMLFFVALFAATVPEDASRVGRALAVFTAFAVDGLWYSLVSGILQIGRLNRYLRQHLPLLARVSALILLFFGLVALVRVGLTVTHAVSNSGCGADPAAIRCEPHNPHDMIDDFSNVPSACNVPVLTLSAWPHRTFA